MKHYYFRSFFLHLTRVFAFCICLLFAWGYSLTPAAAAPIVQGKVTATDPHIMGMVQVQEWDPMSESDDPLQNPCGSSPCEVGPDVKYNDGHMPGMHGFCTQNDFCIGEQRLSPRAIAEKWNSKKGHGWSPAVRLDSAAGACAQMYYRISDVVRPWPGSVCTPILPPRQKCTMNAGSDINFGPVVGSRSETGKVKTTTVSVTCDGPGVQYKVTSDTDNVDLSGTTWGRGDLTADILLDDARGKTSGVSKTSAGPGPETITVKAKLNINRELSEGGAFSGDTILTLTMP